jgi:hypothetical protein
VLLGLPPGSKPLARREGSAMRKVLSIACILCASTVQADPSPSVRYLMGESVSLFEWGIFRLQTRTERFTWDGLDIRNQFARVEYDWPKNQLRVRLVVYPRYQSLQKSTARQVCGSLIRQMKGLFGVAPGFEFIRGIDGIGTFFRHQQFAKSDVPETLDADLEAITSLEVEVMASRNDQPPFRETISCSSELLKSETRYFTTSESR